MGLWGRRTWKLLVILYVLYPVIRVRLAFPHGGMAIWRQYIHEWSAPTMDARVIQDLSWVLLLSLWALALERPWSASITAWERLVLLRFPSRFLAWGSRIAWGYLSTTLVVGGLLGGSIAISYTGHALPVVPWFRGIISVTVTLLMNMWLYWTMLVVITAFIKSPGVSWVLTTLSMYGWVAVNTTLGGSFRVPWSNSIHGEAIPTLLTGGPSAILSLGLLVIGGGTAYLRFRTALL